jgi:hypothetical protein
MRRLTAGLALLMVLIAWAPAAASAAPNSGFKRCKNVVIRTGIGTVYTQTNGLFQRNTSCTEARKVARRYLSGSEGNEATPRPLGYRCSGGADGVSCKKGRKIVTWGYYQD